MGQSSRRAYWGGALTAFVAVVLLHGVLVVVVRAQDAQEAEARSRFEAGRLAFTAGRYEDALADFQRAHELSGHPELLYNVGQAADRLRRDTVALEAFEAYLAQSPSDTPLRAEVEARVAVLRAAAAAAVPEPEPPREVIDEQPPRDAGVDLAPWAVIGSGGALMIAGVVCLALGVADRQSVTGAPQGSSWSDVRDAYTRAPILEGVGGAGLAIGVIAVGIGVVMLTLPRTADRSRAALRLSWHF